MNQLARRYSMPARTFSRRRAGGLSGLFLAGQSEGAGKICEALPGHGRRAPGFTALDHGRSAFSNAALPWAAEKSAWKTEACETEPGIAGLKSIVQSVKGEAERNAISTALEQARWNRKAAARLLQVSYRTLLYKIEQYHMSPPADPLSGYGNGGRGNALFTIKAESDCHGGCGRCIQSPGFTESAGGPVTVIGIRRTGTQAQKNRGHHAAIRKNPRPDRHGSTPGFLYSCRDRAGTV